MQTNREIIIPFFSPFLATKYANIKPSGVYTTTVQDMLQENFKRRNKIRQMRCFNILWHINSASGKTRLFENVHK